MDIATTVVIDCLDGLAVGTRPLVVDEETGALVSALKSRKLDAAEWMRRAVRPAAGMPWPEPGRYSSAHLRLPKAKDALDFALHAMASVAPPGAPMVVFGGNDEGIRSAAKHLEVVAENVRTIVTRRHCRVIAGFRRGDIPDLRGTLESWRSTGDLSILGATRRWVRYPGVFAKGQVDPATALLLGTFQPGAHVARVLDFAAGTGVIAAAVLQLWPAAHVDMVEIDSLALAAARENVPAARGFAGSDLSGAPQQHYDLIVSNPPIHEGIKENHRVLEALICDAPARLVPQGELRIVVQRRIPAAEVIAKAFGEALVLAEDTRFRVLSARKMSRR